MLVEALIRPARPGDSEAIAALMREGVSEPVRRITILGSPYLPRFIADELARNKNDDYVVCTVRERVVGMCGWRHTDAALHLNHLYLAPSVRGQGLGTVLMLDGLRRIRRPSQDILSVDVFSGTPRAQAWYRSLHLRLETRTRWIELPLPLTQPDHGHGYTVSGLDEAAVKHLRYGFSQFTLTTNLATYRVGRLGQDLFRVCTFSILDDPVALQGLTHLDPERRLVCSVSEGDSLTLSSHDRSCLAESERLVSSCMSVREHLESSLSRRQYMRQTIPIRFEVVP
ncbi:MAG: GNAT family N-acetyltransferase [Nitrospira sp.]|nr:GNAT family N-acetyltransferase [Nitrospira sp.]